MSSNPTPDNVPAADYGADSYARGLKNEKSIYQNDARTFHRPGHSYAVVKGITAVTHAGAGDFKSGEFRATLGLGDAGTLELHIAAPAPDVFRLRIGPAGHAFRETSDMLLEPPLLLRPHDGLVVQEESSQWRLRNGGYSLLLAKNGFGLELVDERGRTRFKVETETIAGGITSGPIGLRTCRADGERHAFIGWRIANGEQFFGLGEKWGPVEKTGTRSVIWCTETCGSNTTDMSYKPVPVVFSTRGWGMMLHSSTRSQWEVAAFSHTAGSCCVEEPALDLFLFGAPTLRGLTELYSGLTGRPHMPPKWAFGVWMSRCQFFGKEDAIETMRGVRARGLPADVIHLDPLWMRTHYYWKIGVDACDFVRNEAAFPKLPELFQEWLADGFNTSLWINPYLPEGQPIHAEAAAKGYLLRSTHGGWARLSHGEPVGMVDFTHPEARAWWRGKLEAVLRDGASVLKPDYGDRVPEDALAHNGMRGLELHNLYLHLFAETAFQATQAVRGEAIVWRRAGYIGTQRYAGTWAGDTQTTWEAFRCCVRGGLSAGFNSECFWSHDIGGFVGPMPSPELFIRWMQFGLLSPFSRFHGNRLCEPWHYGETAVSVARHYARLRYRLVPYLLALATEACTRGWPLQRHCAWEFQGEPGLAALDDQILLGGDLLLLPVMEAGADRRTAYLPGAGWSDYHAPAQRWEGGRWYEIAAPLETMPVLVRAGALIPRYTEDVDHLKQPVPEVLELTIWPGVGTRSLRFDDGRGLVVASLEQTAQGGRLHCTAPGRRVVLRWAGHTPAAVLVDGSSATTTMVGPDALWEITHPAEVTATWALLTSC